jgi:uroporphyrinogen decarboxylase
VGARVALQGNLDPTALHAAPDVLRAQIAALLSEFGAHPGHVFNLGHGITPAIDPAQVAVLVDAVHVLGRPGTATATRSTR